MESHQDISQKPQQSPVNTNTQHSPRVNDQLQKLDTDPLNPKVPKYSVVIR